MSFQWSLFDSKVPLSGFSNFCKLRTGDLISGDNQFCRMSELFGPPSVSQFEKFPRPKFCAIYQLSIHFVGLSSSSLRVFKFLQIKKWDLLSGVNQFCRMSELFVPPLLHFNLKSSEEPNSASFVRFQSIVHESGTLF